MTPQLSKYSPQADGILEDNAGGIDVLFLALLSCLGCLDIFFVLKGIKEKSNNFCRDLVSF